jgi:hypothetical protein
MAEQMENREADRFAAGTGRTDTNEAREGEIMPGVTGGGTNYVPPAGPADATRESPASAEGTIGAVGEMDFTGAPAGTTGASHVSGANPAGITQGGGPGDGSMTTGGTGPGIPGPGPQSVESTVAILGDREPDVGHDASGTGGMGGAGSTGGAAGSDAAAESERSEKPKCP